MECQRSVWVEAALGFGPVWAVPGDAGQRMCHACGPNRDCESSPSVTGISPLWTFFFGGVCWQLCWRESWQLGWSSALEDWAFLAASWQYWGIPVACWWWRSSSHCNIVRPWQLRAAPWQISIWKVNQDVGTWRVMMVNGEGEITVDWQAIVDPPSLQKPFCPLFSPSQKGRWCGNWWPLRHGSISYLRLWTWVFHWGLFLTSGWEPKERISRAWG